MIQLNHLTTFKRKKSNSSFSSESDNSNSGYKSSEPNETRHATVLVPMSTFSSNMNSRGTNRLLPVRQETIKEFEENEINDEPLNKNITKVKHNRVKTNFSVCKNSSINGKKSFLVGTPIKHSIMTLKRTLKSIAKSPVFRRNPNISNIKSLSPQNRRVNVLNEKGKLNITSYDNLRKFNSDLGP